MEEYRALHHARYLERERIIKERSEKKKKFIDRLRKNKILKRPIDEILEFIKDVPKEELQEFGLQVLDAINNNENAVTNFNNRRQVQTSQEVQQSVKKILGLCGIEGDIDVTFEMDCSRDEEIARSLSVGNAG